MFCPRCGERFNERGGHFHCVRGRMEVPAALTEALKTRFGEPGVARTEKLGGRWFCPRCATLAVEQDGQVSCPRGCGSLNPFIADFEKTPHWLTC